MARNINQVYSDRPTTTIPDDALIYLGLSPYGLTDDSAIKSQDIFPANGSVTNGNIVVFNGTSGKKLTGASLTNGQIFIGSTGASSVAALPTNGTNISWSGGAGTLTANLTGIVSTTLGGTGVSNPTIHTIPISQGSSAFNLLGPLTNGQLIIGSTGVDPVAATLTAGSGISITNGAGTVSIAATGGGFRWVTVNASPQALSDGNAYIVNTAGLLTFTLPTTCSVGDTFMIVGKGAGGWTVTQSVNQLIHFGNVVTTTGVGGSLSSTTQSNIITITCLTANLEFTAYTPQGNITVV